MRNLKNEQSEYVKYWKENCELIENGNLNKDDFVITVSSSNIPEIQYLVLMLNSIKNKNPHFMCNITIKHELDNSSKENIDKKDGDWARISTLLSCMKHSLGKIFHFDTTSTFGFKYRGLGDRPTFRHIFPLIHVKNTMYLFLRSPVEKMFLNALDKEESHFNVEYDSVKNKTIIDETTGDIDVDIQIVYRACLRYLFGELGDINDQDFKNHYFSFHVKRYSSKEFYGQIKHISVLAFLIFCMQKKTKMLEGIEKIRESQENSNRISYKAKHLEEVGMFFKSEKEFEEDNKRDDEDILINTMNMADGLLQLIENIIFHAGSKGKNDGEGILSLRLYNLDKPDGEIRDSYIIKKYGNYFNGQDNRRIPNMKESSLEIYYEEQNKPTAGFGDKRLSIISNNRVEIAKRLEKRKGTSYYLEVRVLDHSEKDMCTDFSNNLKDREESLSKMKIRVRTFFDPNQDELEWWKKYTLNKDNIVHHYGLQLFNSLLESLDGCFVIQSLGNYSDDWSSNIYSTSGDGLDQRMSDSFLGTQYSILLPFGKLDNNQKRKYSFSNVDINYRLSEENYKVESLIDDINLTHLLEDSFGAQSKKNDKIMMLAEVLKEKGTNGGTIGTISLEKVSPSDYEILAKAIFLFIANNYDKQINIALTNCNDGTFIMLIMSFALLYDRNGNNPYFNNAQIFMVDKDLTSYFLMAGGNLKNMVVTQTKLETRRGIQGSRVINFLETILSLRPGGGQYNTIRYVPFNILLEDKDSRMTLFEKDVRRILNEETQKGELGCLLEPNHMRIGSKIHVDRFYEAINLFGNSEYTRGFSWLLKKRIDCILKDRGMNYVKETPLLFVGYEVYSEMLLRDLTKYYPQSEYCVFEYGTLKADGRPSENRFNHISGLHGKYFPIYVVPISSTTSTYNKLEADFDDLIVGELKDKNVEKIDSPPIYIGVIQTLDVIDPESDPESGSPASEYIKNVNKTKKTITSKVLDNMDAYYLFEVEVKWFHPLVCEMCYPSCSFAELPIIETNKTSVVPAQLYGINIASNQNKKDLIMSDKPLDNVDVLEKYIIYGHKSRGGNHFEYYIRSEELFEDLSRKKLNVRKSNEMDTIESFDRKKDLWAWLDNIKKIINSENANSERICLNIIVCPEHHSNRGFVMAVNDRVFDGSALVVNVDSESEFRDNFVTKYCYLKNKYDDFVNQERPAEIKFHFVDDTINHGSSFHRVKSLIRALFGVDSHDKGTVRVNLFQSIILLVDRNSQNSRLTYIDDLKNYHVFLSLHISSQRTHGNACTLCQETNELLLLSKRSSLKAISENFYEKYQYSTVKDVFSIEALNEEKKLTDEKKKRYFMRMRAKNTLSFELNRMDERKNDRVEVFRKLCKLLYEESIIADLPLDEIISYIVACSSPFLSFRKSNREAVMALIIVIFEFALSNKDAGMTIEKLKKSLNSVKYLKENGEPRNWKNEPQEMLNDEYLKKLLEIISKNINSPEQKMDLIRALVKQSILLKSSFVIRKENLTRLILLGCDNSEEINNDFLKYYTSCVKRLISSGSDEAKALFVEFLLLSGNEIKDPGDIPTKKPNFDMNLNEFVTPGEEQKPINPWLEKFMIILYLENTQIIYDASTDLYKKADKKENDPYYLKNYYKLIRWNGNDSELIRNYLLSMQKILHGEKPEVTISDTPAASQASIPVTDCEETPKVNIIETFSNIADEVSTLMSGSVCDMDFKCIDVRFIIGHNESILVWNENEGDVSSEIKKTWGCFAKKSYKTDTSSGIDGCEVHDSCINDGDTYSASGLDNLLTQPGLFEQDTYLLHKNMIVIKYISTKSNDPVYLVINFSKTVQRNIGIYGAIRYVLTFRNKIEKLIEESYNKEQLRKHLEDEKIKGELKKARVYSHQNIDDRDFSSLDAAFYPQNNLLLENTNQSMEACSSAYKQYLGSILGTINIKLLLKDKNLESEAGGKEIWKPEERGKEKIENKDVCDMFCKQLSSICYLPRWDKLHIEGLKEKTRKELEGYFNTLFKDLVFRTRKDGSHPQIRYLVAFIAEILNGAAKDDVMIRSKKTNNIRFSVSAEKKFLIIENDIRSDAEVNSDTISIDIHRGLRREKAGISFATTCGFFNSFYDDKSENVKIKVEKNKFIIFLPIFNGGSEQ